MTMPPSVRASSRPFSSTWLWGLLTMRYLDIAAGPLPDVRRDDVLDIADDDVGEVPRLTLAAGDLLGDQSLVGAQGRRPLAVERLGDVLGAHPTDSAAVGGGEIAGLGLRVATALGVSQVPVELR